MASRSDRFELALVGSISILFILLTSLPYLGGYSAQTRESVFFGAALDRSDYAVHLATMHLGAQGGWQYRLQFTSEPHNGAYVKLAYIFLGHVANWLGLSIPGAYQLGRVVFSLLACGGIYGLITQIFLTRLERLLAFGLALFGSGLGWLEWLVHWSPQTAVSPIDFWLIDPYIFMGGMAFPHFSMITGFLAIMADIFLWLRKGHSGWLWGLLALLAVLSQFIQPYAPFILDLAMAGVLGLSMLKKRRLIANQLGGLLLVGFAQIPLLIYNFRVFSTQAVWKAFSAQNITLSPSLSYYVLGFGFFWPFALIGVWFILKTWVQKSSQGRESPQGNEDGLLLAVLWAGIALGLAFLPGNIQRRFMHAYTLPLGLLASFGFARLGSGMKRVRMLAWFKKRQGDLALALVLLSAISSLYLSLGISLLMRTRPAELFVPVQLAQAVDWLSTQASSTDVVLASEQTSQLVAAWAGLRVYCGHPIETVDYPLKARRVASFFSNNSDRQALLDSRIRWVIYSPGEFFSQYSELDYPFLELAYQNDGVRIYRALP